MKKQNGYSFFPSLLKWQQQFRLTQLTWIILIVGSHPDILTPSLCIFIYNIWGFSAEQKGGNLEHSLVSLWPNNILFYFCSLKVLYDTLKISSTLRLLVGACNIIVFNTSCIRKENTGDQNKMMNAFLWIWGISSNLFLFRFTHWSYLR